MHTAGYSLILKGFGSGMGLIVAIGAQNSFVLSQGIRNNYPYIIALVCIGCDALLITAGVCGVGNIVSASPFWERFLGLAGALFLFVYGARALSSVFRHGTLGCIQQDQLSFPAAIGTTLSITLLNPHVYLDTLVLMGTLATAQGEEGQWYFAWGAILASTCWFFMLSFGGQRLGPIFSRAYTWKILNACICLVMWSIAYSLVVS